MLNDVMNHTHCNYIIRLNFHGPNFGHFPEGFEKPNTAPSRTTAWNTASPYWYGEEVRTCTGGGFATAGTEGDTGSLPNSKL